MEPTNVLIGDSQYLVREGLEQLVTSQEQLRLQGVAETGQDLLRQAAALEAPAVIILDYQSELFGLGLIKKLKLNQN